MSQSQTDTALVPTAAAKPRDFSNHLDLIYSNRCRRLQWQHHLCRRDSSTRPWRLPISAGVPPGTAAYRLATAPAGVPSNVIPACQAGSPRRQTVRALPEPNASGAGYNYLSNPSFFAQVAIRATFASTRSLPRSDNIFYRFSVSRAPSTIPGPFAGLADGGGFFYRDRATTVLHPSPSSETHVFSPTRVNEIRLGYNRLHPTATSSTQRRRLRAALGFPGVPYQAGTNNGGLPQLYFNDAATLGSPTYLPSNEIQNTYSVSDTFTFIAHGHSIKFGGEFRPEEFTIFQPADTSRHYDLWPTVLPITPGRQARAAAAWPPC